MGANSSAQSKSSVYGKKLGRFFHTFHNSDDISKPKKKKISRFLTLRRRILSKQKHGSKSSHEISRSLRDVISSWHISNLRLLVDQYEGLFNYREISLLADVARPTCSNIKTDLSVVFEKGILTDAEIVYRDAVFPVHRAIVCIRCPYIRSLFDPRPHSGARVTVKLKLRSVDTDSFAALLQYLYTNDPQCIAPKFDNQCIILKLIEDFGTPNLLEYDLRMLLETEKYSDTLIIFTCEETTAGYDYDCVPELCEPELPTDSSGALSNEYLSSEEGACASVASTTGSPVKTDPSQTPVPCEFRCHSVVLAARSPFFRNILYKRNNSEMPMRISLDESVIPRKYAQVILRAIYLDTVDLSCIVRSSASVCSLSEAQVISTGQSHLVYANEAMELYSIGQLLELPVLYQGCEDIIADSITLETLVPILHWSSQPHGSQYVYRQAINFIIDEFTEIAQSAVLCDLSKEHLLEILSSDFVQASEVTILKAVVQWGEYQLMRQIEEREPNILSHTTHSVSRKGIKRRDLNDEELRDLIIDLLPLIRIEHILPAYNEVKRSLVKRGLLCCPPPDMPDSTTQSQSWLGGRKPRLYLPYVEESKAVLEEALADAKSTAVAQSSTLECPIQLRNYQLTNVPDLYNCPTTSVSNPTVDNSPREQFNFTSDSVLDGGYGAAATATLCSSQSFSVNSDILHSGSAGSVRTLQRLRLTGEILVPDDETLTAMGERETDLLNSSLVQKVLQTNFVDRQTVLHQIYLRVVREFGFPDSTVRALSVASKNRCVLSGAPCSHVANEYSYYSTSNTEPYPPCPGNEQTATYSSLSRVSQYSLTPDATRSNGSGGSDTIPDVAAISSSACTPSQVPVAQASSSSFVHTPPTSLSFGTTGASAQYSSRSLCTTTNNNQTDNFNTGALSSLDHATNSSNQSTDLTAELSAAVEFDLVESTINHLSIQDQHQRENQDRHRLNSDGSSETDEALYI